MKTLYESLLDIDNIETDTNITEYLLPEEFQKLYKRKLKSVDIEKDNPVCVSGKYVPMASLCRKFNAKNINVKGIYPGVKIKAMYNFASNCRNLISFNGPNAHENYSELESLEYFFSSDFKLKSFNLSGIAESAKKIKYIEFMFNGCESIEIIDLSYFDFSNLVGVEYTFKDCMRLRQIDMGNSAAIITADNMCQNNLSLIEFNAPNMILSGNGIFTDCSSLKNINTKYIDVSGIYHNQFRGCIKLENVNMYGLSGKYDYIDFSWAVSLNDKSWDFLFKNLNNGNASKIELPDTPKKEKLIKKYESVAKQHDFELI